MRDTNSSKAITKDDIPYLDGDHATIDLPNDWTAEIRVEPDPDGELSACAIDHGDDGPCASQTGPWIGIIITVRDAEQVEVQSDSLWGIEDDPRSDYWREVAAEMINGIIEGVLIPNGASTTNAAVSA